MLLALPFAAAAPLVVSAASPALAAQELNRSCGVVKAATWNTGGRTGNSWVVTAAARPGCSFAKASAAKLTKEKSELTSQVKVAPRGYVCTATPIGKLPLKIVCIPVSGKGGFDITASGYRP